MTTKNNTRQQSDLSSLFDKIDSINQILYYNSYQALAYNPNSGTFAQSSLEPVNEGEGNQ